MTKTIDLQEGLIIFFTIVNSFLHTDAMASIQKKPYNASWKNVFVISLMSTIAAFPGTVK